jgi:hypothetical protein
MTTFPRFLVVAGALALAACGGAEYGGEVAAAGTTPGGGGGGTVASCADLFSQRVQPRLEFCRNCHVPGGVADVTDGNAFMLSATPADDATKLRASWETLGRNDAGVSRILKMASGTDAKKHSGGAPWPVGSVPYQDMEKMLRGYVDPAACVISGMPVAEFDLLGSKHARHLWSTYCEGKDDAAVLPPDPRSLVRDASVNALGTGAQRAVFFNAFWQDCHVNAPAEQKQATTCGEYRARVAGGRQFLLEELPTGATAASTYNNTWKDKWGLSARPANFDEMYTLRYGLNPAPFDNPYPLPGEEANLSTTFGGTGQLPLGLRQTRDAEGKWTGSIASGACFACHGGNVGIAFDSLGLGNSNYDVVMSGRDSSPFAGTQFSALMPGFSIESFFNLGIRQRGQNNAVGAFELLMTVLDVDSLGVNPQMQKTFTGGASAGQPQDAAHPIAHTQDTPPWWNLGSRPRKFFDAGVSSDSTRIIMAAGATNELLTGDGKAYRDRIEQYDHQLEAFFLSLRSPDYPGPIDTELAKQGAILFHGKDLFAAAGNADRPKPLGGNGSCASCHGAYSPRYVNDPTYLATPALEGVAGHIAPLDVIGTDRARSDMLTKTLRIGWDMTYWGYPEGMAGYVAPEDKDPLTEAADDNNPIRPVGACGWEKQVIGYQAPPLYGTWATAPYFHNGSVPTIEAVLDSSQRHPIWRRQLLTVEGITGFDQRLTEAYDFDKLGWKSEGLACTDMPGTEQMNCSPVPGDAGPSITQVMDQILAGLGWTGAVAMQDPAADAVDKRLVYDSRILGNSNAGHEFTDALTAPERRAIIEYLKTL